MVSIIEQFHCSYLTRVSVMFDITMHTLIFMLTVISSN